MKIAKLQTLDVVNGNGICLSLWVQGCPFHCKGCHNPETWDFQKGYEININQILNIILQELKHSYYSGFSILGGEPLCKENLNDVEQIIKAVKNQYPEIKIWVWTGYTIEELQEKKDLNINYILSTIDVLIDGRYIDEERDLSLPFRGSRNQRIIHLE